jgi:hypothetical protein
MVVNEVEEWLTSIGLQHLFIYFIEDGFSSLNQVRKMRQSDIDAIVDRNGYMLILNEEIDKLNYIESQLQVPKYGQREKSYIDNSNDNNETRDSIMTRYEYGGVPAVGFASRHFARRAKSKSCTRRSGSALVQRTNRDNYIPNSASDEYESLFWSRRATSVAPNFARETELEALNNIIAKNKEQQYQRRRNEEQARRSPSEMHYNTGVESSTSDNLDRGKFRDHYTNDYVWVEKNHVNDVGCKYDGLSRKVDHKPSHWRCEDEIERGKEYKRMNDECADKIADNRYSIDNSRDWLVNDGGVVDRVHRMTAKHLKARYDLDSIKRNMENIKAMKTRLLKY